MVWYAAEPLADGRRLAGRSTWRRRLEAAEPAAVHGPAGRRASARPRRSRCSSRRSARPKADARPDDLLRGDERGAQGTSRGRHADGVARGLREARGEPGRQVRSQATALGVTFGDPTALATLRTVLDGDTPASAERQEALAALLKARDPELARVACMALLDDAPPCAPRRSAAWPPTTTRDPGVDPGVVSEAEPARSAATP